ncbi:MAG: hypothetical protein ACR2OB_02970 [Solirubrobacteraceae bacterium]
MLARDHRVSRALPMPSALKVSRERSAPTLVALALCVALAAVSAVLLPTVPSYDPWAWIVWGREVVDPHLSFVTGGGPSWKPLPVLFTSVFGLFGAAAPTLWVITARTGGLLALLAAWRLACRLTGSAAAPLAGVVAMLGVLLTQDFTYYMFRGASEPMLVAAALWAIDRALAGRHAQAFAFGVAASLIRPEAWPFVGIYAVWLWIRQPQLRVLLLAGVAAIPVLWFIPTWIGSGQPFLAASHAKAYNGHLGRNPVLEALRRSADLQVLPILIAAAIAVALAWFRERERLTLALAGGALAWIGLVVAMVIDGYPGLERFFLPASAVLCVLGGVGVARVALLLGGLIAPALGRRKHEGPGVPPAPANGRADRKSRGGPIAALAVGAVLITVSIPLSASRIASARAQPRLADRAVKTLDELSAAVNAVGGHRGVFPCRSSFSAVNHGVQTALAWKLHVTLARVGTSLRKPGVDFIGPHNSTDGAPAPVSPRLTGTEAVAAAGVWRVLRVTRPGHSTACVGAAVRANRATALAGR